MGVAGHVTYQKRILLWLTISTYKMAVERSLLEGKFLLKEGLIAYNKQSKNNLKIFQKENFDG